jgi:hypothetical protein
MHKMLGVPSAAGGAFTEGGQLRQEVRADSFDCGIVVLSYVPRPW